MLLEPLGKSRKLLPPKEAFSVSQIDKGLLGLKFKPFLFDQVILGDPHENQIYKQHLGLQDAKRDTDRQTDRQIDMDMVFPHTYLLFCIFSYGVISFFCSGL